MESRNIHWKIFPVTSEPTDGQGLFKDDSVKYKVDEKGSELSQRFIAYEDETPLLELLLIHEISQFKVSPSIEHKMLWGLIRWTEETKDQYQLNYFDAKFFMIVRDPALKNKLAAIAQQFDPQPQLVGISQALLSDKLVVDYLHNVQDELGKFPKEMRQALKEWFTLVRPEVQAFAELFPVFAAKRKRELSNQNLWTPSPEPRRAHSPVPAQQEVEVEPSPSSPSRSPSLTRR